MKEYKGLISSLLS